MVVPVTALRRIACFHLPAANSVFLSSNIKAELVNQWRAPTFFMADFMSTNILFFLTFLLGHITSARAASNCPSDPYLDPSNDPCNSLGYIANNTLSYVALGECPKSQGTHQTYYFCIKVLYS